MKLFLDDVRPTPEGWYRVYTASEAIVFLFNNWEKITHVSLDHDLGEDEKVVGNGYQVVVSVEEFIYGNNLKTMPEVAVHSSNSSARLKMEAGIRSCQQLCERNRCNNT